MLRRPDPFDRKAMILSVALHSGLLVLGWLSTFHRVAPLEFITYEIELVSPPPAVEAELPTPATEELVVERPDPTPPEPEVEEEITPIEQPEPEPDPPVEREETNEQPPEPDEEENEAAAPEPPPEEVAEESGEDINVRLEGVRRDYPEYYNNIIRQIQRCFRWRGGGSWETMVYFVIERDGAAADIEFVTRSGNTSFDFEAMGAVDCAGGQGRFGPLPEDLPFERLEVQFSFRPTGEIREEIPANGLPAEVASGE